MANITTTQIGINHCAAPGAQSIDLYNLGDGKNLTLGQLVIAVCIQRAATLEHACVEHSNEIAQNAGMLKSLATITETIMNDAIKSLEEQIDWAAQGYTPRNCKAKDSIKNFLVQELGLTVNDTDISTYSKKMSAYNLYKRVIDTQTNLSQRMAIELQSLVGRRDITYNTSSSVTRNIQTGAQRIAGRF